MTNTTTSQQEAFEGFFNALETSIEAMIAAGMDYKQMIASFGDYFSDKGVTPEWAAGVVQVAFENVARNHGTSLFSNEQMRGFARMV